MSTNYYLDRPENEAGHLGKWSGGRFHGKAPKGVDTFAQWAAQMDGRQVFTEYGAEVTAEEMVATALRVRPDPHPSPIPALRPGEFIDRGVLFVRYDFC